VEVIAVKNRLIAVSVVLVVGIGRVVFGATWYVAPPPLGDTKNPGTEEKPFSYIQSGINAAGDGDTVLVARGTYVQNLDFKGKNIVVNSTDPLDADVVANTIIDGNGAGSCVTFSGDEDETCVLSGFTIRNGAAETGGGICGGTFTNHTHATIRNNVITANHCDVSPSDAGGGLYACDGPIENNIITENSSGRVGGGVAYCNGVIRNNTISANSCNVAGGGLQDCEGIIEYNVISGNSAFDGGGLFGCGGTIRNNVISGNSASQQGGGLSACMGTIQNNIIVENVATPGDRGWGGGLFVCQGNIRNNLIIGNTANQGAGLHWCDGAVENNTIFGNEAALSGGGLNRCHGTIYNCIIWANRAPVGTQMTDSSDPTYSCIKDWSRGGEGNISPKSVRFVNEKGGDYRLLADSPCIDAGSNSGWMWDAVDPHGNARIVDGDGDGDPVADMGAYEFTFVLTILGLAKTEGGEIQLTWNSRPGDTYIVRARPDFVGWEWIDVATVASQGMSTTWSDSSTESNVKMFYRVETD
jgi:hypothetical protein